MISNSRMQITLLSFLFKKFNLIKKGINITVDAMEVLIKYCMNSFPQVDQFMCRSDLCISYWSIGSETKSSVAHLKVTGS